VKKQKRFEWRSKKEKLRVRKVSLPPPELERHSTGGGKPPFPTLRLSYLSDDNGLACFMNLASAPRS
jgi:hypothetical protein